MIEAVNLGKRYERHWAVRSLEFSIKAGEVVALLGPNGAGKSTTLRMLTGFLEATEGRLNIAGFDPSTAPEKARKQIGFVAENAPLYPELRPTEYLRFRAELKGIPKVKIGSEIDRVLQSCKLFDYRHRLIGKLSKGYRQRLAIAESLLGKPPLLIFDEPASGLDPLQRDDFRDLVHSLGEEQTVLISSHVLAEASQICSRVLVLAQGRLVADSPIAELGDPRTKRYRLLLKADSNNGIADRLTELWKDFVAASHGSVDGGVRLGFVEIRQGAHGLLEIDVSMECEEYQEKPRIFQDTSAALLQCFCSADLKVAEMSPVEDDLQRSFSRLVSDQLRGEL